MLADQALIEEATARMNRYSVEGFTHLELLELQQRREAVARSQPVLDHNVYQKLTSETSPTALGASSFAKVLSQRLRISDTEARRRLDDAERFGPRRSLTGEPLEPKMPTVARGQAQGLIGAEHVKHLRWFVNNLPLSVDSQTRENAEQQLAQHACELGPEAFRKAAAHLLYLLDQDGEFSDEDRQAQAYLRRGKQRPDGLVPVEGLLTPEMWATLEPLLEKNAAPGMNNPDDESPCVQGEPSEEQKQADHRSAGKRNHDALLALCRQILATMPTGTINGFPANVVITVSLTDLEKGIGHGLTAGGAMIPICDVLKIAAHSRPWLAIFDGKGIPLHFGRARRTATLAQRLVLLAKHRGCTMPGCTASAYRSQVHHANSDWKAGGQTDIEDLTLACGPDNRMVETTEWTTRNRPEDGVTEWIPPPELDCGQSRTNNLHHPGRIIGPDDP
ncbi:HNH endonuclease signature motif containing protein [Mycobacterium sp. MS1601]|uniref:HNH endonuclease signature motif containing protein n=1 Tax=Mycobacterium sp. MS1601 TaxID=1936029 RepID=UPI001F342926|nr:HNH endonuclease signature motif containing protein [Mycobacterium sp. MS1601]